MNFRHEKFTLAFLAGLHLIVVAVHGYSHFLTGTPNTAWQMVFIVIVVMLMPPITVYIAWFKNLRLGSVLFAASMSAAFLFGYYFHFFHNSPDLCTNVSGVYKDVFLYSAMALAVMEIAGLIAGMIIWSRNNYGRSNGGA